jgi:hypothetical protein
MQRNSRPLAAALATALMLTLLPACEDKGPVEQAAEEVDEGIDTMKRGGESTANKVDDAMDEAREAAKGAAADVRQGVDEAAAEVREETSR